MEKRQIEIGMHPRNPHLVAILHTADPNTPRPLVSQTMLRDREQSQTDADGQATYPAAVLGDSFDRRPRFETPSR